MAWVDSNADRFRLRLPTAHIWGRKDTRYSPDSKVLWSLCEADKRELYIHGEGHEVPGARAKEDVQACLRVIRRVLEKASVDR